MSKQPHEDDSDFFEHHEWGLKDHAWEHIYEEVLSLNKEGLTAEELQVYLAGLNTKLYSSRHFDAPVYVSGKLRDVHARGEGTMYSAPRSVNLLPEQVDEDGQYRAVIGEELICRYFAVHTPDGVIGEGGSGEVFDEDDDVASEDRPPRIVMTLSDLNEEFIERGPLYMFLEENDEAVFEDDVSMEDQQYLDYYHPEVIDHIDAAFAPDENGEVDLVAGLRSISLRGLDGEAKKRVENYIFNRLGIDYLIAADVDGYVGSIGADGEIVDAFYSGDLSPFDIAGVWLYEEVVDGEIVYRPSLAGVIADPESSVGFQARIIPPDSLRDIESLRPRYNEFGKVALKSFDDRYQVIDLLKGGDDVLYDDDSEDSEDGLSEVDEDIITPEEQSAFRGMVAELTKKSQDMTEISRLGRLIDRENQGYYVEDVTDWSLKMYKSFIRHIKGVRVPGPLDEDTLNEVVGLVEKDMIRYDNVLVGEFLQIRGTCQIVDTATNESIAVGGNYMVRGEFRGLVPLSYSREGQQGESLGLLFGSAVLDTGGGYLKDEFENGMCIVVLDEKTNIERVVYQDDGLAESEDN